MLINRNFALMWFGKSISLLGDFVFDTTLVLWIATELAKGQPWSSMAVSGVFIIDGFVTIIVGPLAGVFADRWDKLRTLTRATAANCILVLALLVTTVIIPGSFSSGGLPVLAQLAAIYCAVFLLSLCRQFYQPSSMALLGDIVEEPRRARATSLNQASLSFAMIAGPPIAAPLLISFGPQVALLIDAATFAVALMALHAIRLSEQVAPVTDAQVQGNSFLRDYAAGLRFFLSSQALRTAAIALVVLMLGGGAMNTLDFYFITHNLHAPASLYGFLGTAQGVGMIVGAVLASVFADRLGLGRLLWGALLAIGALTLVYARMTSFLPGVLITFVIGLAIPAINIAVGPIMLKVTPREMVGRVSSTFNPLTTITSMAGAALGGFLYSTALRGFSFSVLNVEWGPLDTIFAAVGVICIIAGAYTLVGLRGTDLDAEVEAEEAPVAAVQG